MADPRLSDVAPTIDICDSTFSLSERIANPVLRNNIAATATRSSLPASIHGANHPGSDVPSDPPKPLAMPTGRPRWLHHGQRVPPVKAAGEPVQGASGSVGGSSRLNGALLIQCQLFMQKEILCCEGRAWVQAEEEKAHPIAQERQLHPHELREVVHQPLASRHRQGTPLWQGCHTRRLSLLSEGSSRTVLHPAPGGV
jgi:hypothetical protein